MFISWSIQLHETQVLIPAEDQIHNQGNKSQDS